MPQPTKLKKPITVTYYHIENAIVAYLKLCGKFDRQNPNHLNLCILQVSAELGQLASALRSAGIDPDQWEPPQPFKIGTNDAEFHPNGSVEFGITTLDRATLLEVLKRSDQAMQKGEEWPRYIKGTRAVGRFDSKLADGMWHYKEGYTINTDCSFDFYLGRDGYTQITRAEACAFLGRDV